MAHRSAFAVVSPTSGLPSLTSVLVVRGVQLGFAIVEHGVSSWRGSATASDFAPAFVSFRADSRAMLAQSTWWVHRGIAACLFFGSKLWRMRVPPFVSRRHVATVSEADAHSSLVDSGKS